MKEEKVWEKWVKRWWTVVDIMTLVHSLQFWELIPPQPSLTKLVFISHEERSQSCCNSPVYFPSLCMSKRVHKHFIKIQWDQSLGFRRLIISFKQQPLDSRRFLCSYSDCLAKGWDFEPVPQKRLSTKPSWTEEWRTDDAQKEVIASWLKFTWENVRGKCMRCVITRHTSDTSDSLILMLGKWVLLYILCTKVHVNWFDHETIPTGFDSSLLFIEIEVNWNRAFKLRCIKHPG